MTLPSLRHARKSPVARAAAALALSGGLLAGAAVPAQAATTSAASYATAADAVVGTAASLIGAPYVYGGTTPAGFDCSGFTSYVFAQHGVALPRTADAQMRSLAHVSAGAARPGDLVFFVSGGRAYHAAVYAGNGQIIDAGSSGGSVKQRGIWSSSVVYARAL